RARQLADHLSGHVRVRARSLDAPLLVVLVGPTGAGKSTVFNTIAGHAASETGVIRPTTRVAVVLVHPDDRSALVEGAFAQLPAAHLRFVEDRSIERGPVLVDAPDIDSLEHANRELTDRLVEAADQADILADVRRLLAEAGLDAAQTPGPDVPPRSIVAVREGALAASGDRLEQGTIDPVLEEIGRLRADRQARLHLATRALSGSLTGLGESLDRIADDAEHESIDTEALRRIADRAFEAG